MDEAAIFTDLTRRNALRKAHGLPLLDLRAEYTHQIWIAKRREYRAACDEHADEREAIRHQVLTEYRARYGPNFPSTTFGHWAVGLRTNERFAAYMITAYHHPDRLAVPANSSTQVDKSPVPPRI